MHLCEDDVGLRVHVGAVQPTAAEELRQLPLLLLEALFLRAIQHLHLSESVSQSVSQ